MAKIQQIWQRWIPGLLEKTVKRGETVESGAEVTKAALEFAIALGVLGGVPSAPVVAAGLSFVSIGRKGLGLLHEKTSQEFNVEEWVAIAFPLAYIQSFDALVQRNDWLQEKIGAGISGQGVRQQFEQLGELQLNESLADEVLKDFPGSTLGQALNNQLSNYVQKAGIEHHIASIITGWVVWLTFQYVESLLLYEPESVRQALSFKISAAREIRINEKYASIEFYLKEQISPNPSNPLLLERWKVIDEEFLFPHIYVSLEAHLLDSSGKFQKEVDLVNLENWAKEHLTSPDKNNQVMFIQAGPGRGKSVFCRMFANWVREHLHPIWTPILIRLRDI